MFYDMGSQIISAVSAHWVHLPNRTMGLVLQRNLVFESGKFSAWESRVKEESGKVVSSGFYSLESKGAHEHPSQRMSAQSYHGICSHSAVLFHIPESNSRALRAGDSSLALP